MEFSQKDLEQLLSLAVNASLEAGSEILNIYNSGDFSVESKADSSPLTMADKNANEIILSFLEKTNIPVISEEIKNAPFEFRQDWEHAWIVDPLDGTKEFIKRNDEFTVNIALVKNGTPILGVVYTPVIDDLYFTIVASGAYKINNATIAIDNFSYASLLLKAAPLPLVQEKNTFTVVASRSHLTEETQAYIDALKAKHGNIDFISKGSSLKLCMVAEGKADEYPRFAPTCEWDTAAGHAIVLGSGGIVLNNDTNEPLIYNKENVLNPWFLVKR